MKKKTAVISVVLLLIVFCAGVLVLAKRREQADKQKDLVYTIYAIGSGHEAWEYALSEEILEEVEDTGLWPSASRKLDALKCSLDDIKELIRRKGITAECLRIVLLHDAYSSSIWEANAIKYGIDTAVYAQMIKEKILKHLGL